MYVYVCVCVRARTYVCVCVCVCARTHMYVSVYLCLCKGCEVTFRVYGITCILILVVYAGVNYFLQDRGRFSHGSKMAHELLEDTTHLAPHGVPSGIGRDLSSSKLARDPSASKLAGDDWNTQQRGWYLTI